MSQLKSVWGQFLFYFAWISVTGGIGIFLGDRKLPTTDYAQTVGVIMMMSIGYFLFQIGLFHAKLNGIEKMMLKGTGAICSKCERTKAECLQIFPSCCAGCSHKF